MNKKELRKEILERRNRLSQQECLEKSKAIAAKVKDESGFKKSNKVLLYAPIRNEVETEEIYYEAKKLNKEIYYPRVLGKEMEFYLISEATEFETSAYGIREPKPEKTTPFEAKKEDIILVVIPGAAFDKEGNRIGYGGGYYDKYLNWLEGAITPEQICKMAVAYECQLIESGKIEKESYDIQVDYIVTEREVYAI